MTKQQKNTTSKDPAVLLYTSDFLTGTLFMNFEERGKYITLLCIQHQKGRLTEDEFFSICSKEDVKIISKFSISKNGLFYNKRLEEEAIKRKRYSESRRNNRLSKNKNKEDKNNICKTYDKHMEDENENENISNKEKYILTCREDLQEPLRKWLKYRSKLKTKEQWEFQYKKLIKCKNPTSAVDNSIGQGYTGLFDEPDKKLKTIGTGGIF